MAKEWYAQWEVTTKAGRLIKREGKITDPTMHTGEFLKRFYPTAVKIEFWEVDDRFQNPGPHRIVEFDNDGKVKSRTPDLDAAHVGGRGWKRDPNNPTHFQSGTSRAGLDPRTTKGLGWHPTYHAEDEGEPIIDKLKRVLPPEALAQPPLTSVTPAEQPIGKEPPAIVTPTLPQTPPGAPAPVQQPTK